MGVSAVTGGVSGIASTLGEINKMSKIPPQVQGNTNCGDVTYAMGINEFVFSHMCIKPSYARIIDDFFSMFGYKTNRVKIPNTNHRERWWYTKTIDVNIEGGIPVNDKQLIKNCYNNGITFWRNGSEMKNYTLSNECLNQSE